MVSAPCLVTTCPKHFELLLCKVAFLSVKCNVVISVFNIGWLRQGEVSSKILNIAAVKKGKCPTSRNQKKERQRTEKEIAKRFCRIGCCLRWRTSRGATDFYGFEGWSSRSQKKKKTPMRDCLEKKITGKKKETLALGRLR